ncbi:MAG: hypothetical protein Q4P66_06980 [Actinomycetaceae bacterium]|nr:hypothetical protein [Actinomycetaceae bacterium]
MRDDEPHGNVPIENGQDSEDDATVLSSESYDDASDKTILSPSFNEEADVTVLSSSTDNGDNTVVSTAQNTAQAQQSEVSSPGLVEAPEEVLAELAHDSQQTAYDSAGMVTDAPASPTEKIADEATATMPLSSTGGSGSEGVTAAMPLEQTQAIGAWQQGAQPAYGTEQAAYYPNAETYNYGQPLDSSGSMGTGGVSVGAAAGAGAGSSPLEQTQAIGAWQQGAQPAYGTEQAAYDPAMYQQPAADAYGTLAAYAPTPSSGYDAGSGYQMPAAYAPYDEEMFDDDDEEESKSSTVLIVFLVLLLVALIAAGIALFVLLRNDSTDAKEPQQKTTTVAAEKKSVDKKNKDNDKKKKKVKKRKADSRNDRDNEGFDETDIRFPAPDNAGYSERFVMPSGNIECNLTEDSVACSIVERYYSQNGDEDCEYEVFSARLDRSGTTVECGLDFRDGGSVLQYGTSIRNGEHACSSSESGLTCWNIISGEQFSMAREGFYASRR